jgi:hypothetical protein
MLSRLVDAELEEDYRSGPCFPTLTVAMRVGSSTRAARSGAERSKSSQFTPREHGLDFQSDAPAESLRLPEDSPRQRSRPLTSKDSTFAPQVGGVST